MAKSLMKNWDYECAKANLAGAASSEDANADPATFIECTMVNLLRSIINGQNAQIQTMRELLDGNGWPEFDNCDRPWEGTAEGGADEVSEYVAMDVSRYGIDDEATGEQVHEHSRRRRRRRQLQTQSDETPPWVTQLADAAATTQVVDSGTATETAVVPPAPTIPARKYARSRPSWIYSPLILVCATGRSVKFNDGDSHFYSSFIFVNCLPTSLIHSFLLRRILL